MALSPKLPNQHPGVRGWLSFPKEGSVQICIDLKPLNQSVLQEVHPIPKVDDTLAQLAGATVFSKIDANSGYKDKCKFRVSAVKF